MPMTDDEIPDTDQGWFYVVKVKHVAYHGHTDDYAEYTYKMCDAVGDLPSPGSEMEFQGFTGDYDVGTSSTESYVCTDIRPIDFGSRKHDELKKLLAKEPWERKAGGL